MTFTIIVDDMRTALAAMEPNSVDSIVCDPPYEYGFMGKAWDSTGVAFDPATWRECLRVLKPGGHLLAFGATRTVHRIACAIEDAGFDIRDQIAWMFGSGFPKSLDVSKAIDRLAGVLKPEGKGFTVAGFSHNEKLLTTAPSRGYVKPPPATPDAQRWSGWGTALKPAMEPIIVARKPLVGTVAANVLAHGTGAINVDGCRIGTAGGGTHCTNRDVQGRCLGHANAGQSTSGETFHGPDTSGGRWPANVILDEAAGAVLDEQSGHTTSTNQPRINDADKSGMTRKKAFTSTGFADSGGASRFFYSAKADGKERDAGLEGLPVAGSASVAAVHSHSEGRRNTHPTVKPIDLMRYLCRLVTPPGGTVLDPFFGSGTTGVAALLEGFHVVGVEMQTDHACIAWHRCQHWSTRQLAPGVAARSGAEKPTPEPTNLDLFGAP